MYDKRHDNNFKDTGGLTFQIAHVKQSQREVDLVIFINIKLES